MKYIELFAGVGGFRFGIEQALGNKGGGEQSPAEREHQSDHVHPEGLGEPICVLANEFDKYAAQTYNKNFGEEIDQRDIRNIPTNDIPDHDLLVGGFPCQAFSVAGKRAGFDDTRGTLFFEIARILADKQPRHLLLENVKGLLSHDEGRTFQTIIGVLSDLGYRVEWQVLNSKDFGVPQNRERVLIVGHLGACCGRQVFPLRSNDQVRDGEDSPQTPSYRGEPAISGPLRAQGDQQMVANTLTANYWKGPSAGRPLIQENSKSLPQAERVYNTEGVSATLSSNGGGMGAKTGLYAVRQPLRFLDRNQKKVEGDYSFTIDASQTSGVLVDSRIRRLTPIECERLQGFPDNWTAGVSDTQRYKQMGNAVTTNVIQAVVEAIYL